MLLTDEWRIYAETDIPEEWIQQEDASVVRVNTTINPVFDRFLQMFQTEGPLIHILHQAMFVKNTTRETKV